MNDTPPIQRALANATVHKGTNTWRYGLSRPVRNMRLVTDGVCIKLLTLRKDGKRWSVS
jgi:hypothetical protein